MRSGWKTTEFWISTLTSVGAVLAAAAGVIAAPVGAVVAAGSAVAYIASRTIVKATNKDLSGVVSGVAEAAATIVATRKALAGDDTTVRTR